MDLKQLILEEIKPVIAKWDEPDIYVISFYIDNDGNSPHYPVLEVGYNTLANFYDCLEEGEDGMEAKWNYAYWLQNQEYILGDDETEDIVEDWVLEQGFSQAATHETFEEQGEENSLQWDEVTKGFADVLVEVVKELHFTDFIKEKFGEEIPVIIHQLEYWDEIAKINIRANGPHLVEDFVKFVTGPTI